VTAALASLPFEPTSTDFYVCGSAAMVADCRDVLEQRRAEHVFIETY